MHNLTRRIADRHEIHFLGIGYSGETIREDLAVKPEEWSKEITSSGEFFTQLGPKMPEVLREKHRSLASSRRA